MKITGHSTLNQNKVSPTLKGGGGPGGKGHNPQNMGFFFVDSFPKHDEMWVKTIEET